VSRIAKIQIGFDDACTLLRELGLGPNVNPRLRRTFDISEFGPVVRSAMASHDYRRFYMDVRQESGYHVEFQDGSILLFSVEGSEASYYYCPNPKPALNEELFSEEYQIDIEDDTFVELYEAYLADIEEIPDWTPLRYDYSEIQYTECVHPVSHLHVGLFQDIRIPISTFWSPFEFVCQVVKFFRYDAWKQMMKNDAFKSKFLSAHSFSDPLAPRFCAVGDLLDFALRTGRNN